MSTQTSVHTDIRPLPKKVSKPTSLSEKCRPYCPRSDAYRSTPLRFVPLRLARSEEVASLRLRTGLGSLIEATSLHSEAGFPFQFPRPLQRLVEQGGKSRKKPTLYERKTILRADPKTSATYSTKSKTKTPSASLWGLGICRPAER